MKHLKQLVRNIIDPTRDLGHVDRHHKKEDKDQTTMTSERPSVEKKADGKSESPNDGSETTIPIDPDAAIALGSPEMKGKGTDKACEDCA